MLLQIAVLFSELISDGMLQFTDTELIVVILLFDNILIVLFEQIFFLFRLGVKQFSSVDGDAEFIVKVSHEFESLHVILQKLPVVVGHIVVYVNIYGY